MMYRTGLKHRPPLANGGHMLVLLAPARRALNPGIEHLLELVDVAPAVWCCIDCHWFGTDFNVREGFYPRPCMGRVAALEAPA